jgi:hypothetical protein
MNKAVGGIFVAEADVITWATNNGVLNGANLQPVIQQMAQSGLPSGTGKYGDGGPGTTVDWTDTPTLQAAIYETLSATPAGTVKIGIAADQLPSGAGNANGWHLIGAKQESENNEDHCMCYCGYGTLQNFVDGINQAYGLSVTVPSGMDPTMQGFAAYTWSTIGFFDVATNNHIVFEAWVRNPSTTVQTPGTPVADSVTVYTSGVPTPPNPPTPPTPPGPPMPTNFTINVPQQPVIIFGQSFGHVPAYTLTGTLNPSTGIVDWAIPSAITTIILEVLRLLCQEVQYLPAPYQQLATILCGMLPAKSGKSPCGKC